MMNTHDTYNYIYNVQCVNHQVISI